MEYVQGRVFKDPLLPGLDPGERQQIYKSMCEVLVKIHSVDVSAAGLSDFGKSGKSLGTVWITDLTSAAVQTEMSWLATQHVVGYFRDGMPSQWSGWYYQNQTEVERTTNFQTPRQWSQRTKILKQTKHNRMKRWFTARNQRAYRKNTTPAMHTRLNDILLHQVAGNFSLVLLSLSVSV